MCISVIIPAYNAANYLAETIESVQNQKVSSWELCVVDDGSKDETVSIAQKYANADPRIRVISQPNAGVSAARNTGFAMIASETQYVSYLDADDTWEPDTLETLVRALEAHPDAAGAYGLPRAIDKDSRPIHNDDSAAYFRERWAVEDTKLVRRSLDQPTDFACEVVTNYVQTAGTLLLRRSFQEKAGSFDERMGGCADWDLWLRLCRMGNLVFVNQVVLNYRLHGSNMSSQSTLMAHDEEFLRAKLLSWPEDTPERLQLAAWGYRHRSKQIVGYRMQWARECLRSGKPVQAIKHLRHAARLYRIYAFGPGHSPGAANG